MQISSKLSWMNPIIWYPKDRTLLANQDEARKLRHQVPRHVHDKRLYKMFYSLPLLWCLHLSKTQYALREIHKGISGNHLDGKSLAHKILRHEYFRLDPTKDMANLVHP